MGIHDDPFGGFFHSLRGRVDELMESFLHRQSPAIARDRAWRPAVDIYETPPALVVFVEIPGMRREEIEVTLQDNVLRIAGYRHGAVPEGVRTCHQMEIDSGPFERRLRIDAPIDARQITAQYQDGFLRITLPKTTPHDPGRVEILSG
ncbi:MAG: Hsp20/alpha crystallin family protein [candidate division NC10 bacterium]|nr:Hsp20/alpha crystallin family protein [candidate division NC10 bacterium]